ncbi:MAG TPA: FkbM family methyltransferase [Gaiellaceae bacterium]|nr:FkbM family methyltransferase [Gaiellaceae bacterium]
MALATAYRLARRGLDRLGVRRLPGAARVDAAVRRALGGARVQVLGHTMRVDRADSLFLLRHGVYEPTMTRLIEERVRAGDVVVDVGANIGYHTLLFARLVGPEGRVVAFEPDEENFAVLAENVRANGYANVELVRAAVADRSGTVALRRSSDNSGDHRIFAADEERETVEVPCVTLDEHLGDAVRVDVVKVDVQGAEAAVLRGMRGVLARSPVRAILTEVWPQGLAAAGDDAAAYLAELQAAGFSFELVDEEAGRVEALEPAPLLEALARDPYGGNVVCTARADA